VTDPVVELEHLLNRARKLIGNAGGGDWNRESGEWQLAAAELMRDLDARERVVEAFVLEPDLTVEQAVMRALGAASTCWTEIRHAGVFDDAHAARIGAELVSWIRAHADTGETYRVESWPGADADTTQQISADAIVSGTLPGMPELTAAQVAAAQDPDGDLEGYDGPMGKPGGYCRGTDGDVRLPHLPGAVKDCPGCGQWYTETTEGQA
jgi:hypothetical protein